ncbi:MAG: hypothetical protein FJZ43_00065 [Candidatus Staskawiczbacteria bacterium]|nr:hypothetical protein [Candidatus Staskawiczbacteria bacterium]
MYEESPKNFQLSKMLELSEKKFTWSMMGCVILTITLIVISLFELKDESYIYFICDLLFALIFFYILIVLSRKRKKIHDKKIILQQMEEVVKKSKT